MKKQSTLDASSQYVSATNEKKESLLRGGSSGFDESKDTSECIIDICEDIQSKVFDLHEKNLAVAVKALVRLRDEILNGTTYP